MKRTFPWIQTLCAAAMLLTLMLMLRVDHSHLRWASDLSLEGNPPPELDASSPTGYQFGQRHFLGVTNRGETYRWIAYAQELLQEGLLSSDPYLGDSAQDGRPQLMPRLYAFWLASIAWIIHLMTDHSLGIAVERAALWEPLIAHGMAFIGLSAFVWKRYGAIFATAAGLFFALFPPFSAQFIPGSLSPEIGAFLLASLALAQLIPTKDSTQPPKPGPLNALAIALSLWLDPAIGFSVLLVIVAAKAVDLLATKTPRPFWGWTLCGVGLSLLACLIDANPLESSAGELRYLHPVYPLAWLGLGMLLGAWQSMLLQSFSRVRSIALGALGLLLMAPLAYTQLSHGYSGWLFSSASLLRPSSLDQTRIYGNLFSWIASAEFTTVLLAGLPALTALAAIAYCLSRSKTDAWGSLNSALPVATGFAAVGLLTVFKIKWGFALSLLALIFLCSFVSAGLPRAARSIAGVIGCVLLFGFFAWGRSLPAYLKRPDQESLARPSDVETLIQRHFSHWLAVHNPTRDPIALAPPEFSDSIIFHGGCRAIMSTAWESFPGQLAAVRVLSSPESTEAEAVLDGHEVTHIVLPSWDPVLPMLVKAPATEDQSTFYHRLLRWLLPLYLRPVPYPLPAIPGYETEKLAVFEMSPDQDSALSLSRLAEYFAEANRDEPANLAAKALAESYPNDPNAAIGQAFAYALTRDMRGFRMKLERLARDAEEGFASRDWDRRVLRAIVFALGKRHELAKQELQACVDTMSEDGLYQLTPLQTYHLRRLLERYELGFPNLELRELARLRSSEYGGP
ncbi:hypothetical protein [Pelagicoccus sp. SDUM812003]|uniref:hypothetical protein n=1 Tax=Pelagicoccus sp. SDUM812003 TaxID=3041267 RepID=UPI00280CA2B3|nr:hypothetical protein [Pelagicoccus sp. SDUM812003]MDQ8203509.1 hypothetical protein [Pelagicoccus sp. SDUM812003]